MNIIQEFQGKYRFLSNFFPAPIDWTHDGYLRPHDSESHGYPTAEHVYQASKSLDPKDWNRIAGMRTPGEAKRAGRTLIVQPDWDKIKLSVMSDILYTKFFQNEDLRTQLLATGDAWLSEGNRWGDEFWGVCLRKNQGDNWLGRLLMVVRSQMWDQVF